MTRVIEGLDAGEWRQVADLLLPYYDKLYDKHIKNETGTGTGTGTRRGEIVAVGDPDEPFDETRLADDIVRQVHAFEERYMN